jgi:hypothetical protein
MYGSTPPSSPSVPKYRSAWCVNATAYCTTARMAATSGASSSLFSR